MIRSLPRLTPPVAAASLLLAACGGADGGPAAAPADERAAAGGNGAAAAAPAETAAPAAASRWDLQSSGEGVALALLSGGDRAAIRLFCPAGRGRLLVNVPGFRPVGSEERLSFGGGGDSVALVADAAGDRRRGGVSGSGPVPDELAALVGGPVSASYGAQRSGPHPAPPRTLAAAFVAACREEPQAAGPAVSSAPAGAGPCHMQDGERLRTSPLRAVGTEPFWGARIEGRCVTYSHPDDQRGTRLWTRFAPGPDGGVWTGALAGRRFELRTRSRAGCSDGMSDKAYPFAVELRIGAERRTGCAEPLER
ncbi:MAG TPA: hypothetical protein VF547_10705 [Allosphingosinicella sp.]|jgi:uncharacterized membrane protein